MAILIRQEIELECIKTWKIRSQNMEALGIRTTNLTINYNLVVMYRKPYGIETKNVWEDILKFGNIDSNTIIIGNFNAHHSVWNCQDIDRNGEHLHEVMLDEGFK